MSHLVTLLSPNRVIVKDGFNRPDNASSPGRTNTGQTWNVVSGTWGISSNQLYHIAGSLGRVVVETNYSGPIRVSVTLSILSGSPRILLRFTDGSNEIYILASPGSNYTLVKRVANVTTTLATVPTVPADGDRLVIILVGPSIVFTLNGTVVASVSDSFNQSATMYGVYSPAADTANRWDDYIVEAI